MSSRADPAVEAENLTRASGTTIAPDDATFTVAAGEIVGPLGPDGAGTTTTMRVLLTLLRPTAAP